MEDQKDNEIEGFEGVPDEINMADIMSRDFGETKVGKKLSDYTTRRVIVMVLAMLFSTPFLSIDLYLGEQPLSLEYGLSLVHMFGPGTTAG